MLLILGNSLWNISNFRFSFLFNITFYYSLFFLKYIFPLFYLRALRRTSVDSSFFTCIYLHKTETVILQKYSLIIIIIIIIIIMIIIKRFDKILYTFPRNKSGNNSSCENVSVHNKGYVFPIGLNAGLF